MQMSGPLNVLVVEVNILTEIIDPVITCLCAPGLTSCLYNNGFSSLENIKCAQFAYQMQLLWERIAGY